MFSEVAAADKKVATATSATLTCSITDVAQVVTVTWKNSAAEDLSGTAGALAQYTVAQGTIISNKQDSTLTITSTGINALADVATIFTCYVKSSQYTTSAEVSKTLTMTKLTYAVAVVEKEVLKATEAILTCTVSGLTLEATIAWKSTSGGTDLADGSDYAIGGTGFELSTNSQQSTLTVKAGTNTADTPFYCAVTSTEWAKDKDETTVNMKIFGRLYMCFRLTNVFTRL